MPCFLGVALSVGAIRPKPGHKGLFVKSPLESQKLCQNEVAYSARKFCGFLRRFFKSTLKRRFGTEFQHITTNKKTRHCRVFLCWHYQLGISVPNPDQRNFSGKVSWNFKSSAKIKRCVLCKVLWRTFLSRKVRSGKVEFCKSAVGGLPVSCGHIFAGFIHCFHDKVE